MGLGFPQAFLAADLTITFNNLYAVYSIQIIMKTIMVTDEAYEKLTSIKGSRSFTVTISELVDRLKQNNTKDLKQFAGILGNDEARALQKTVTRIRKAAGSRL